MVKRLFLDPYVQLFLSAACVAGAEICLKLGASALPEVSAAYAWTGVQGLASGWVWGGIVFLILSFGSWLWALKLLPLSVAYPLANVVHVLVPLGAWVFLGEQLTPIRWCGIALVLFGLTLVARPLGRIEERL